MLLHSGLIKATYAMIFGACSLQADVRPYTSTLLYISQFSTAPASWLFLFKWFILDDFSCSCLFDGNCPLVFELVSGFGLFVLQLRTPMHGPWFHGREVCPKFQKCLNSKPLRDIFKRCFAGYKRRARRATSAANSFRDSLGFWLWFFYWECYTCFRWVWSYLNSKCFTAGCSLVVSECLKSARYPSPHHVIS